MRGGKEITVSASTLAKWDMYVYASQGSCQFTVYSYQFTVISCQLSVYLCRSKGISSTLPSSVLGGYLERAKVGYPEGHRA